jgi:hypothetical protein
MKTEHLSTPHQRGISLRPWRWYTTVLLGTRMTDSFEFGSLFIAAINVCHVAPAIGIPFPLACVVGYILSPALWA